MSRCDASKPGIDREQALQAAQQQSRAHQQHEGERDLRDDERAARPLVTTGGTLRALLQSCVQVARDACSAGISPTTSPISVVMPSPKAKTVPSTPIAPTRGSPVDERHQRPHTEFRHQHPQRAAEDGKQQTLGEQLPDHPRSSRAERGAHREFAAPLCAAREQEIRHVHAGDREHQYDRAEDGEQRRLTPPVTSSCSEFTMNP